MRKLCLHRSLATARSIIHIRCHALYMTTIYVRLPATCAVCVYIYVCMSACFRKRMQSQSEKKTEGYVPLALY